MFRGYNARPSVKKVSALVDKRSHKQRKYISLMLVPSYSSGKTRSLRIPRVVFYCIIAAIITVATITTGFYLRGERFAEQYRDTRVYLEDTQEYLELFQQQTEEEQQRLMDESLELEEQLTEQERMARIEQNLLRQQQQNALNDLQYQIDELEDMIREFDQRQQSIIDGISTRTIIPAVATLFDTMQESRAALIYYSILWDLPQRQSRNSEYEVGFTAFSSEPFVPITEADLLARLELLTAELELQILLMDDLQSYRERMDPHLRNFPTLWPITAQISSPFGWRSNPMGGGGGEFHSGIDLRSPSGTPIRAAGGGTVTFVGWRGGYGQVVIINHGSGIQTLYAHNSVNLVTEGQRVERGDIIARVGTTGRTTGAHLHFEVILNGTAVNPRPYMLEHWN